MAIITLTTDFGIKDHYVGSIKGAILKELPDANIVDISHLVLQFNIQESAFVLKSAYTNFPKNTIHIVGVKAELTEKTPHIIVEADGHYFIGADNGVFSLMFGEDVTKIILLPTIKSVFPTLDVFVKTACEIAKTNSIEQLGKEIKTLNKLIPYNATSINDLIRGSVEYIDVYGNVISNISEKLFNEVRNGRDYSIEFTSRKITKLSQSYSDVKEGEKLALFNSSGFLEIAMNNGTAFKLIGIKINDPINIHFF